LDQAARSFDCELVFWGEGEQFLWVAVPVHRSGRSARWAEPATALPTCPSPTGSTRETNPHIACRVWSSDEPMPQPTEPGKLCGIPA